MTGTLSYRPWVPRCQYSLSASRTCSPQCLYARTYRQCHTLTPPHTTPLTRRHSATGHWLRAYCQVTKEQIFSVMTYSMCSGTLWCGVDDIAETYYSLGPEWQIDKCCRAHDHCPVKVKGFKTRYGVFNLGPYTKSHCACDKQFYDCLKKVNNHKSNAVGDIFFNVIGVQCVEKRVKRRCVKTSHKEGDSSESVRQGRTISGTSERQFNIGLSLGVRNKSECLVWRNDPPETAQFVIVNVKEKY